MRATRAFFGAFGAGVSLAIAGSLALLLVSSVIAFKGWPDDIGNTGAPEVALLSDAGDPAGAASDAHAVALPKARTPKASAGKPRGSAAHGGRGASTAGMAASRPYVRSASTQGVAPAVSAPVPSSTVAASAPSVGSRTGTAVHTASGAVRATTKAVGDSVAPASPTVGGALQSVGAAGADSVGQVGQTVDKVAGGVLP